MRTKDDLLNSLGLTKEYNPHGGETPDAKDILLIEVLIDIRDILSQSFDDIKNLILDIRKVP